ncbi:MAG: NotI family restriction endonuclease [Caldilineaceae bacterium]
MEGGELALLFALTDCVHLLTLHEPGNTLHIVSEVVIPGGSVDYFLVSARGKSVKDSVGIELQTLDTTGTVWPERQNLLREKRIPYGEEVAVEKSFGMNWKMTAKTILVQLHHKVETFESINKHLVLALQDHLLTYMKNAFDFGHLEPPKLGNSVQLHSYALEHDPNGHYTINLSERFSTDARGVAKSLGLQQRANVELETIINLLESKISDNTILHFQRL